MTPDDADLQRAWLERILASAGLSPTELARRAGLDHSTLTRFLKRERGNHELRKHTIRKIEQATGAHYPDDGPEMPAGTDPGGFADGDGIRFDTGAQGILGDMVRAALQQRNNVDAWTLRTRAIELLGYRPGDVVIVALGEPPLPGDVVCFQVYDWQTARAETKFRLYQPPVLVAASSEAALLKPYSLADSAIAIKGVVLNCLRARQAA